MFLFKFSNIKNAYKNACRCKCRFYETSHKLRRLNVMREKKAQSTDFARIIKSRVTNNSDETVVDSLGGFV